MNKLLIAITILGFLSNTTFAAKAVKVERAEQISKEMARYVEEGILDCGLTGKDWIVESNADVKEITELVYGKVGRKPLRWVLAVPENGPIKKPEDLEGKRISTEAVGMTKKYLAAKDIKAHVEFSWGGNRSKTSKIG